MTLKEKSKEYAQSKHTDATLQEIVSWDFEAGAKFVIEEIYKALNPEEVSTPMQLVVAVYDCLEELERE